MFPEPACARSTVAIIRVGEGDELVGGGAFKTAAFTFLLFPDNHKEFLMKPLFRTIFLTLGAISLLLCSVSVWASDFEAIETRLAEFVPDVSQVVIAETPLPGIMQIRIGGDIVYMSEDGRFLLQGRVIDMDTHTDLTDAAMSTVRKEQLAGLDNKNFVSFGNSDAEFDVLVFTDPDCGYCRRLHEQVEEYNAAGIRIHYMAFPRAGIGSQTYDKMVSVWCADDRQSAMDIAKAGGKPPEASCENPVTEQYQMGQTMGVTGTPSIMTFNGDIIPGYVPPTQLRERLKALSNNAR
jgi:thiol:disulfide interchange protein DsbC